MHPTFTASNTVLPPPRTPNKNNKKIIEIVEGANIEIVLCKSSSFCVLWHSIARMPGLKIVV
jgi:hypothetical protein